MVAIFKSFSISYDMEIVLLGHMGRDEATVDRLEGHKLHILGEWENPGLVEKAEASGGQFKVIDSIKNVELIADHVQAIEPDMFLTNFEDALAAGVVDVIKRRVADKRMPNLLLPCPDRAAAQPEWDKWELRKMVDEIDPKFNPLNRFVSNEEELWDALEFYEQEGIEVALKPRNLAGGKGVKVMGPQLRGYEGQDDVVDGRPTTLEYGLIVLRDKNQTGLEVQEKLEGHEFTLQLFTDGTILIKPPATYDHPYREDGDKGPGTGGMGAFTMQAGEQLPFITEDDYNEAVALMQDLLVLLKERGLDYKGILYPTFFKTADGLKIVEVNARGGDPELINILDLLEDDIDYAQVLKLIALGELEPDSVRYKKLASAMLYLVSPEYAYRNGPVYVFDMDPETIRANDCLIRYAAAEKIAHNKFRTVGSSRTVGLSALGKTPWEARAKIHAAIGAGFGSSLPLKYRQDIGDKGYIQALAA
jgi:phosphoribosylamine---glycine ligase